MIRANTGISSDHLERLLFLTESKVNLSILNLAKSYRAILDGDMNDMELSLSVIDKNVLPNFFHTFYESLSLFIGNEGTIHGTIAVILPLSRQRQYYCYCSMNCSLISYE